MQVSCQRKHSPSMGSTEQLPARDSPASPSALGHCRNCSAPRRDNSLVLSQLSAAPGQGRGAQGGSAGNGDGSARNEGGCSRGSGQMDAAGNEGGWMQQAVMPYKWRECPGKSKAEQGLSDLTQPRAHARSVRSQHWVTNPSIVLSVRC